VHYGPNQGVRRNIVSKIYFIDAGQI